AVCRVLPVAYGLITYIQWHICHLVANLSCRYFQSIECNYSQGDKEVVMKKYVIEREIPKIGNLNPQQVREAAGKSNDVLAELGPAIQWQESYITADKMFCVYLATDEQVIQKHAEMSGFPASKVTEIRSVIDPTTAA